MKIEVSLSSASERVRKQTGVVPYRETTKGNIEVMLIESSHAGNWGLPKGKKEKEMSKRESALVEAWEEAGVKGSAGEKLGTISYRKGSTGVLQKVVFYAMRVDTQHMEYPESWRKRKWFKLDAAIRKCNAKQRPILERMRELYDI